MELVSRPGVPLILIPTTAGTGSEMISICVLSDTKNKVKKDLMSEHMFAREALLNPQLTLALPPRVTVITGMDALVHAIEPLAGDPDTSKVPLPRVLRGCQRSSRPDNGLRRRPWNQA